MSSTVAWTSLRQQIVDSRCTERSYLEWSRRPIGYVTSTCAGVILDAVAALLVGDVMREVTSDWEYEAVGGLTSGKFR